METKFKASLLFKRIKILTVASTVVMVVTAVASWFLHDGLSVLFALLSLIAFGCSATSAGYLIYQWLQEAYEHDAENDTF